MLLSTQAYQPGDVILEVRPFLYSLLPHLKGRRCDACFQQPIPGSLLKNCSRCFQAWYCDKKCQQDDWHLHKHECPVLKKHPPGDFRVPITSYFLRALLLFKARPALAQQKHKIFNGIELAFEDSPTHRDFILKDKELLSSKATLFKCLEQFEIICQEPETELYCRLKNNTHAIYVRKANYCWPDVAEQPVASGLSMELPRFGHSCAPSAFVIPDGIKTRVVAARKINVGEQLTIDKCFLHIPLAQRRRQLKKMFNFDCLCLRCQTEELSGSSIRCYRLVDDFRKRMSFLNPKFRAIRAKLGNRVLDIFNRMYWHHHPEKTGLLVRLVQCDLLLGMDNEKLTEEARTALRALRVTNPSEDLLKLDSETADVGDMVVFLTRYVT